MFQWARRPLVGPGSPPPPQVLDDEPVGELVPPPAAPAPNGHAANGPVEDFEALRRLVDKRFEETEKRLETERRLKEDVERLQNENAQLEFDLAAERERAIRAAELTAELERTLHASEEISERERASQKEELSEEHRRSRQLETELNAEREMRANVAAELVDEKARITELQSDLATEWTNRAIERERAIPQWRYSAAIGAAVVALICALAAFAARQVAMGTDTHARDLATIAQAEAGLGQPSARVGAILTLDAYRQASDEAQSGPLRSVLLSALLSDDEFAHATAPPWSAGAFADHGRMFVSVNRSGEALSIAWPGAGRSATQKIDFQPSFVCGFRGAAEVAVADGSAVRLYSYSFDSGTRAKVTSRVVRAGSQITAVACMPQSDTVAVAETSGSLAIVDMARGQRTTIAQEPNRVISGIVPSNDGRFIAAIAPAMQSFTLYSTGHRSRVVGTRRLQYPGCYTCIGRLAFDAAASRVAWIDGTRVEIGRLSAIDAGSQGYDCGLCRTDAALVWSAQDPLPKIIMPGAIAQFDDVAREYRASSQYTLPRGAPALPVFDPDSPALDPHVATREADGIAFRSLADGRPPMVGVKAQCTLPASYAVMRGSLLLGGRLLTALRFESAEQSALQCGATDPILGDAGDGEHAVWLDTESGVLTLLRIVDQGLPFPDVQKMSEFVLPQELHGESRGAYEAAYDPEKRVISVASSWGVQQFSPEGRRYGELPRSRLDELAGAGHSDCPIRLSPRGTYVFVPSSLAKCETPAAAAPGHTIPGTLVTTSGVRVKGGVFTDLWQLSRDDRFAFGVGATPGKVVYRLPSMEAVPIGTTRVLDGLVEIAPDGRTMAYQTNDRRLQLFDLDRQAPIASTLTVPPHFDTFHGLRFSPDGKHLVASYRATDGAWLLAAYDLDPAYWRQQLCDQTKDLTAPEKRKVGQLLLAAQRNTAEDLEIAAGEAAFRNACPASRR